MKKSPKIQPLTTEEMKQQNVIQPTSGDSGGGSGDSGTSNKKITLNCPFNNQKISCTGISYKTQSQTINGKEYLDYITCTKADGTKEDSGRCDLTPATSGTAPDMWTACDKKQAGDTCYWYDLTGHKGQCKKENDSPYAGLYCDETF